MRGFGFYLYRPKGEPAWWVERAMELGASWIAPRVLGWYSYDQYTLGFMDRLVEACRVNGLSIGGWGYHVLANSLNRGIGQMEGEAVVRAVGRWGLDFYIVNGEKELKVGTDPFRNGHRRNGAVLRSEAGKFWRAVRAGLPDLEIGMTSYRYPKYHREFIWDEMLDTRYVDFVQPQVYWEYDYRPHAGSAQLGASYLDIRRITDLPYVPLLPTYRRGNWIPTRDQLIDFGDKAREIGLEGFGAYTLDHATQDEALKEMWKPEGNETGNGPENPAETLLTPPEDGLARLWTKAVEVGWFDG